MELIILKRHNKSSEFIINSIVTQLNSQDLNTFCLKLTNTNLVSDYILSDI